MTSSTDLGHVTKVGRGGPAVDPLDLYWLPATQDFRAALREALTGAGGTPHIDALVQLAQHRLGFLQIIQLDNALRTATWDGLANLTTIRLAVLSSSTVDHLLPAMRVAALRKRLYLEIHVGPFGQYRQEILDPTSPLRQFLPDVVLLALSSRDAVSAIVVGDSNEDVDTSIARAIDEMRSLWLTMRQQLKATVVQQSFLNTSVPLFGSYDRIVASAPATVVSRLNLALDAAAASSSVLLLDVARASERQGIDAWFDFSRWLHAKQEIAPQAAAIYGELLARVLAAQRGLSRKCLVLDLDNTLWGGVVGDDGIDGIVLGQGSAVGEAHLALQSYAKQLKERGIILAVCSKNDPATAERAFREHPEMLLRRTDIAAFVANWGDKAENLRAIATTLNIGLDSLVFVDDNAVERARVRTALPMVAVPELPEDCAFYARCLADAGYFEAVGFTAEDRQRGEQYVANAQRDALRQSAYSVEEFLRGLDMTVRFGPFTSVDAQRITQLINKTNQFNPTTRRWTQDQIASLIESTDFLTLQFRLLDSFGDNGLVSAMILRALPTNPGVLEIDTWVMSCRVFGRQLEVTAMNLAVEAAASSGARIFRATYIPTEKNSYVRDLYPSLSFGKFHSKEAPDGTTNWSLDLDAYRARDTWIKPVPTSHDRSGNS